MTRSPVALSVYVTVVFVLAGCGGSQTSAQASIVPQGAMAQRRAHGSSGSSGDLLYVVLYKYLSIYTYPKLKKLKTLNTGTWLGLRGDSNPNNGDMCFDNYAQVFVFKHGATQPYVTIPQPPSAETFDC